MALLVIANHEKLAELVAPTLWEEFNGRGGNSGMWWRGDLKQVADNYKYASRRAPKGPQDVIKALGFSSVTVLEETVGYKKPVAELSFSSLIDEEHGIGLLTDGKEILGTGYAGEAFPYEEA